MKKIIFDIEEIFLERMDAVISSEGFSSRSEFLRFLVRNHIGKTDSSATQAPKKASERIDFLGIRREDIDEVQRSLSESKTK